LIEAVRAKTDFFPRLVEWNTSMPQIIVGLSINGKASTVQGMPPILAVIWIKILLTIDLKFLPFEMVLHSTTWEGTGNSASKNLLMSSYSCVFPLAPGSKRTHA